MYIYQLFASLHFPFSLHQVPLLYSTRSSQLGLHSDSKTEWNVLPLINFIYCDDWEEFRMIAFSRPSCTMGPG